MKRLLCLPLVAASLLALDRPEAPQFRAKSLDGETFTNASIKGKVTLIQFWTTWCGFCRADEPAVERLVEDYGVKLRVIAVSVNESKGKVEQYLKEHRRKSKIVVNQDTNLPAVFGVEGFPMYVLLDEKARIAAVHPGAGTAVFGDMLRRVGLSPATSR